MQMKRIFLHGELNSTKGLQFFSSYIVTDACFHYKSITLAKVIFFIEKSFYGRVVNSAEMLHTQHSLHIYFITIAPRSFGQFFSCISALFRLFSVAPTFEFCNTPHLFVVYPRVSLKCAKLSSKFL